MKKAKIKDQKLMTKTFFKKAWKSFAILAIGFTITFFASFYIKKSIQTQLRNEFELVCNEIKIKIDIRLHSHAQLLRSGSAYFAASDSVTKNEWETFYKWSEINKNLPGIQGYGFSLIVKKEQLQQHVKNIQNEGFPDYKIYPVGDRELYTSIVFLEPFDIRNQRAFGYDMYSEPIRRQAMEQARDFDIAALSGKVLLVQETNKDLQAGALMYVPIYQKGMPTSTVNERRAAILGWVYSPYRMNNLMNGILGRWDLNDKSKIHLQVFDNDSISQASLLFDSQRNDTTVHSGLWERTLTIPIVFNNKKWTLLFSQSKQKILYLQNGVMIVFISGFIISILLFSLSFQNQVLSKVNKELFATKNKIATSNIELLKLNTDKDRFISILAHDLKSPFNTILGFLDLLTKNIRKYDINKIEKHINIVNQSAKKTFTLMEDILMWIRANSGKIPFKPQHLNFATMANEVIATMQLTASTKNITINSFTAHEINIYADSNMLHTVLRNLISNAIKYTNPGGIISINADQNISEITVSVIDNGIGMTPTEIRKLFDVAQAHSMPGTANEQGTGLGLLLCKEFVEKHGGEIWVESEEGKGSEFKFSLPYSK